MITDMKRHYSTDLEAAGDGAQVTIKGYVESVRKHGKIAFCTIRDMEGPIYIVAKTGKCPDDVLEKISKLKQHSCICINGKTAFSDKAPSGVEIIPLDIEIYSTAEVPPIDVLSKTAPNIDTRLNARPLDLKREVMKNIFTTRNDILYCIRNYFYDEKFMEVTTPKIISSAAEGGSSLFSIFYYDKQAYLAQSPQLYKEQLTMPFEKVFEIGPIFRAEASRTNRHLSEATSIDFEEAYADYHDIMDRIETIVDHISTNVNEGLGTKQYEKSLLFGSISEKFKGVDVPKKIPRHSYTSLVEKMQSAGLKTEYGDDLHPAWLEKIGMKGFYFITDWPLAPKPFYVMEGKNGTSESFDLMYDTLEISSGSTRTIDADEITERLKNKGMNVDSFKSHLDMFKYGMPPHAGCGIGLERLMMTLLKLDNIRDATFYPRDVDRLHP